MQYEINNLIGRNLHPSIFKFDYPNSFKDCFWDSFLRRIFFHIIVKMRKI